MEEKIPQKVIEYGKKNGLGEITKIDYNGRSVFHFDVVSKNDFPIGLGVFTEVIGGECVFLNEDDEAAVLDLLFKQTE